MEREPILYTRKSRALDKDTPDEELFRKHKAALFRRAQAMGVHDPQAHYHQEVGSSETIEGRPVFNAIMKRIDAKPYQSGVDLIVMDQDRISRAELGELGNILGRLKLKGTIIRQAYGGDLDLNLPTHYNLAAMKGVFNRMVIDQYKEKRNDSWNTMRLNGEVRQGKVPWGYWNDKSEKRVRDRIKPDERWEFTDGTGLTRWERLCRICEEVRYVSVTRLAEQYNIPRDTLFSTLGTPTICGWPVQSTAVKRDAEGNLILDKHGKPMRKKLPREEWLWPDHEGDYPKACTLQRWHEIQEEIESRRAGKVKHFGHDGICRDVVKIDGCSGNIVLARMCSKGRPVSYRQLMGPGCDSHSPGCREVEREVVDAHASAALKELVADPAFFGWMIAEYYQGRKAAEPEDTDQQLRDLNQQIGKFRQDMDKAKRFAYEAETPAEAREYQKDARRFMALIEDWEKKKAALKVARSPIPAVDAAVPALVQLTEAFDPTFWAEHWDAIWGRLSPLTQRLLIRMCIAEIAVSYQQRCYRGPAVRQVRPVVYSDFVAQAQAAYAETRMSYCKIVSPQSVVELWANIAALVPLGRNPSDRESCLLAAA